MVYVFFFASSTCASFCFLLSFPLLALYFTRCLYDSLLLIFTIFHSSHPLFISFSSSSSSPRVTLDPTKRQSSNKSMSGCTLPQGTKTVSKSSFPMFSGCFCLPDCLLASSLSSPPLVTHPVSAALQNLVMQIMWNKRDWFSGWKHKYPITKQQVQRVNVDNFAPMWFWSSGVFCTQSPSGAAACMKHPSLYLSFPMIGYCWFTSGLVT